MFMGRNWMPVTSVDLLPGHQPEGLLDHALRARVAVVVRVGNERPVPVQEPEVHAPGIHPDAFDLLPPHGLRQPSLIS